jgi:hypothetical protein
MTRAVSLASVGEVGTLSHACLGVLLYACEAALDLPELLETNPP